MVSKEFIIKGFRATDEWKRTHPKASVKEKFKQSAKLFKDITEIEIKKSTVLSCFVPLPESAVKRMDRFFKRKKRNNKAQSPIEIILTIMVMLILMIGVNLAMGNFVDGFIFVINQLPISLLPKFQHMLGNVVYLAVIFWAIPSFFVAVLVIWGVKTVVKKHIYSRQMQGGYDDF